jgi:predicted methyltransferase
MIRDALRPGGVVAVWSASPDPGFTKTLQKASFYVTNKKVRAAARNKGPFHTIWIARKKNG